MSSISSSYLLYLDRFLPYSDYDILIVIISKYIYHLIVTVTMSTKMYGVEFKATPKQLAAITRYSKDLNKHDASFTIDLMKMITKRAEEGICVCHCRNQVNSPESESHH